MQAVNFFNLSTVTRTGEGIAKEGVHYKIIKDGNGTEYRIANFENPDMCPRTGIVELIPMRLSQRHANRIGFRIVHDRKMGIIWGIPTGIDPETKKLQFQKIDLVDSETFDLSDAEQAMKWACVKNSFFVEGSPNLKGKPKYKVHDVEREAQEFLSKRITKRNAINIAETLQGQELVDMARDLGIDPGSQSVVTLQMAVIKKAEDNADSFMKVWDNPNRRETTIFNRAVAFGIITQDPVNGWVYGGAPLGPNEVMAVQYLKDYPQVCRTIDLLTQQRSDETDKAMATAQPLPRTDDRDNEIARLRAELQQKEAALKKMTQDVILDSSPEVVDDVVEALRAEAKRLGIRGYKLYSTEKLKAEILKINPEFELQNL